MFCFHKQPSTYSGGWFVLEANRKNIIFFKFYFLEVKYLPYVGKVDKQEHFKH